MWLNICTYLISVYGMCKCIWMYLSLHPHHTQSIHPINTLVLAGNHVVRSKAIQIISLTPDPLGKWKDPQCVEYEILILC